MNEPLRLLFDECLGQPIMASLATLLEKSPDRPELRHILEFQKQGVPDAEWIPKIAAEHWIVITTDRGKQGRAERGGTLPMLCRLHNVTHILMSGTLHQRRGFDKALAIAQAWPQIVALREATPGSRHSLRLGASGNAIVVNLDLPSRKGHKATKKKRPPE